MKFVWFLFSLFLALTGCQVIQSHEKAMRLDEAGFMQLWDVYQRCRTSADPVLMRLDVERLGRVAATTTHDFPSSLPTPFDQFVSKPPLRLAVDPKALAADCALRAGQVASDDGRPDLATELFLMVMQRHPESEYTYYVGQARVGLAQIVNGMGQTPKAIPISSPR